MGSRGWEHPHHISCLPSFSDLRGLWLYRLESRVGLNYRLKCLAWTGRQQEPRMWSQDLPSCPCSLQQGQQDPRFKSSRGGKWHRRAQRVPCGLAGCPPLGVPSWGGPRHPLLGPLQCPKADGSPVSGWSSARVSMLHSASPNRYGAGVRCLYDSRGQLVEGRQERYWRSSRQVSPFRGKHSRPQPPCVANQGVGGLETSPCQAARHQLEPVNHFNPRASLSTGAARGCAAVSALPHSSSLLISLILAPRPGAEAVRLVLQPGGKRPPLRPLRREEAEDRL